MLSFSRSATDKREKIDINTMIEETLELVRHQARLEKFEVKKILGQDIPAILAHKNQLQQVIINLCTNAIDSMKGKKGRLEIRTCKEKEDGYCGVKMEIEDNGTGMTEEVKKRIFEPFFSTKDMGKGTGLGLSIVYGIIEKHNGRIDVENRLGEGSNFIIFFVFLKAQT